MNRGEWSELYVAFKLLSDGAIGFADSNLQPVAGATQAVDEVHWAAGGSTITLLNDSIAVSARDENGVLLGSSTPAILAAATTALLSEIQRGRGASFDCPAGVAFAQSLGITHLKTGATSKCDIYAVVPNHLTGVRSVQGFSVKSLIGGSPTLFNASKANTRFRYELAGTTMTTVDAESINAMSGANKIVRRVGAIYGRGSRLAFDDIDGGILSLNLQVLDSRMPEIVAEMLLTKWRDRLNSIPDLCASLERANPLGFDQSSGHQFYECKIRRLLRDIALGLYPTRLWLGRDEVSGGAIVVSATGDLFCFHADNMQDLEDYLFANTMLDTPSTSASKHDYGYLEQRNGAWSFTLNLQVRF